MTSKVFSFCLRIHVDNQFKTKNDENDLKNKSDLSTEVIFQTSTSYEVERKEPAAKFFQFQGQKICFSFQSSRR